MKIHVNTRTARWQVLAGHTQLANEMKAPLQAVLTESFEFRSLVPRTARDNWVIDNLEIACLAVRGNRPAGTSCEIPARFETLSFNLAVRDAEFTPPSLLITFEAILLPIDEARMIKRLRPGIYTTGSCELIEDELIVKTLRLFLIPTKGDIA